MKYESMKLDKIGAGDGIHAHHREQEEGPKIEDPKTEISTVRADGLTLGHVIFCERLQDMIPDLGNRKSELALDC